MDKAINTICAVSSSILFCTSASMIKHSAKGRGKKDQLGCWKANTYHWCKGKVPRSPSTVSAKDRNPPAISLPLSIVAVTTSLLRVTFSTMEFNATLLAASIYRWEGPLERCVCVGIVRVRYLVLWGNVIALRAIRSSALGFDLALLWLVLGIAVVAAAVVLGPKEALLRPQYGAFHRCWFLSFDHLLLMLLLLLTHSPSLL